MPSACRLVLETPELLESILIQLPPHDLLLAQRISRNFQTLIEGSPTLQQALFFRPTPFKEPTTCTLNPLLREPFFLWFVILESRYDRPSFQTLQQLYWFKSEASREAFLHPGASWRRMLIIQPPPVELRITKYVKAGGIEETSEAYLSCKGNEHAGVTMDAPYDISVAFVSAERVSEFTLTLEESEDSTPQLTLHLTCTKRRGVDYEVRGEEFRSKAAKTWSYSTLKFKEMDIPPSKLGFGVDTVDDLSDLSD